MPNADCGIGMAKPCPDVLSPGENAAGFVSDHNPIGGFSHLHDSGMITKTSLLTHMLIRSIRDRRGKYFKSRLRKRSPARRCCFR